MDSAVSANECVHSPHHTNAEGESLAVPAALVDESSKDLFGILTRAEGEQRDHNTEEAQDVNNENHALELWKEPAGARRDDDAKSDDGPEKKSSMPVLRDITGLGENEYTLNKRAGQVC